MTTSIGVDFNNSCDFEYLVGKTVVKQEMASFRGNDAIVLTLEGGERFVMTHYQDCCENVGLEDTTGSWDDIVGQKVMSVYENSNGNETVYGHETYTFYTINTFKGSVTLRWYGSSNGYYSESVGCYLLKD